MESPQILIVDDNADLAENLAEILGDMGFSATVFFHPLQALERLKPGQYTAALLDIRMPEMDGVELYRRIKQIDPGLPAIAVTAYSDDDRVQAALEEGILMVLPKPIDVPRLLRKLSSLAEGEQVLIVEDEKELGQNLAEILVSRGFSPRLAGSCMEARGIAPSMRLSVLLADWRLPDGNGLELIEDLCRQRTTPEECLAIVFSGYPREIADPENKMEARGVSFFEKPLSIEKLLHVLSPRATRRKG